MTKQPDGMQLRSEIRNEDGTVTLTLVSGASLTYTPDGVRPGLREKWLGRLRDQAKANLALHGAK
jgi:hypothetical protein